MVLQERLGFCSILALIYLLNPLVGIILTAFMCIKSEECPKELMYMLFVFIACWLGTINMTKIPLSDMVGYIKHFNVVPNKSFVENILHYDINGGREPLYALINYIGYYVSFGKAPLFIFYLTFSFYMLMFSSIYKIYNSSDCSSYMIVGAVFAFAFFPQVFGFTAHLIRQMLATAIVVYAIAYRIETGKNNWFLLISAIFIHTMTGLLVLLSVISILYKKLNYKNFILCVVLMLLMVIANSTISYLLKDSSSSVVAYASSRLGNSGETEGTDNFMKILLPLIFIFVFLRSYKIIKKEENHIWGIMNITMLLAVFILAFQSNPFIQMRFALILYSLVPILVPILFYKNILLAYWGAIGLSFAMVVFFLMKYNNMGFEYAEVDKILSYPLFMLFFQSHSF